MSIPFGNNPPKIDYHATGRTSPSSAWGAPYNERSPEGTPARSARWAAATVVDVDPGSAAGAGATFFTQWRVACLAVSSLSVVCAVVLLLVGMAAFGSSGASDEGFVVYTQQVSHATDPIQRDLLRQQISQGSLGDRTRDGAPPPGDVRAPDVVPFAPNEAGAHDVHVVPVVHYEGRFRLARRVGVSVMYPSNAGLAGTSAENLPQAASITCTQADGEIVAAAAVTTPTLAAWRATPPPPETPPEVSVWYQLVLDTVSGGVYVDVVPTAAAAQSALCTVSYSVIDSRKQ